MVAILFCEPRGIFSTFPGRDLWTEASDARNYQGSESVVAHPPCTRWCALAGLVEARWGHKRYEDGGCFASALANVRRCGGVLEHPAYTAAFRLHGLPTPDPWGGWQRTIDGGWVAHVEQVRYGHRARKATWLYLYGVEPKSLRWGYGADGSAVVGFCKNRRATGDDRKTVTKRERNATPREFALELLRLVGHDVS